MKPKTFLLVSLKELISLGMLNKNNKQERIRTALLPLKYTRGRFSSRLIGSRVFGLLSFYSIYLLHGLRLKKPNLFLSSNYRYHTIIIFSWPFLFLAKFHWCFGGISQCHSYSLALHQFLFFSFLLSPDPNQTSASI